MLERLFPQQADDKLVVEDVFSTWLYTGNGSTQTITNGIDLAGKGGLVWSKARSSATGHNLFDTARGRGFTLYTNLSDGQFGPSSATQDLTSFNNNGFSLGTPFNSNVNSNTVTYASWTFRKAPKFFDVVTYTGNGGDNFVNHSLGVRPGLIIIKRTNASSDWPVAARTTGTTYAYFTGGGQGFNSTSGTGTISESASRITTTSFDAGWIDALGNANAAGQPYVAYLFAHDPSADGIIQCGSYTGNGSTNGPEINLGWEPQWLLIKNASGSGRNWLLFDNMRGMVVGSADAYLAPNTAGAEGSFNYLSPTATGFQITATDGSVNNNGQTFIYVAIRRGPMRTPTLGTSVFSPVTRTGTGANATINAGITVDMAMVDNRNGLQAYFPVFDRLRGARAYVNTTNTGAEDASYANLTGFDVQNGVTVGADTTLGSVNFNNWNYINYFFRRAPGFFDVVCYTGTSGAASKTHNLQVIPELIIVKVRNANGAWFVYSAPTGSTYLALNSTAGVAGSGTWTTPASSSFTAFAGINDPNETYVAYLFASAPGVSKVGSYTGNGSSQTINCAFTTGARFVLIKRTDSTGDWWVWDTARGIVSANDPALRLNSTAAETTGIDSVDPDSTGFIVNQDSTTNINVNAATYIFLAIA
jgi:hypothetical protein